MRRLLVLLSVELLLTIGCLACEPEPAFEVALRLSPTPALVGPTRLIIDVADNSGDPVTNAVVSIEGLPDEPARVRPTEAVALEEGPGRYVVPGFDLDVRGPWTITVTVRDRAGVSVTRGFPISVFGGP